MNDTPRNFPTAPQQEGRQAGLLAGESIHDRTAGVCDRIEALRSVGPEETPSRLGGRGSEVGNSHVGETFETGGMVPGETSGPVSAVTPSAGFTHTLLPPTETPSVSSHHRGAETRRNTAELNKAQEMANLCEEYLRLTREEHLPAKAAAHAVGKSPSFFSGADSMLARYLGGGVAALLPASRAGQGPTSDLTKTIEAIPWFLPAARFFYLCINFNSERGSVPEALRRVMSLPVLPNGWTNAMRAKFMKAIACDEVPTCPPELKAAMLARERKGDAFVPSRISRQIVSHPGLVKRHRRPKAAALDYLSAPGSTMWIRRNGAEPEFARAGAILEADDGTINFPVCIPWTMGDPTPDDKCVSRYGVMVGRFQWLRARDVGSRFRPAWAFIARPRSSYRGEDVLSLLRMLCLQHGVWEKYRFEQNVWKSKLVVGAIKKIGAELDTVYSPHAKPYIEGGFNQDWTKLSVFFPHCDLGRYAGDTERTNQLVQACRKGHQDPRRLFPMLADAMAAFEQITEEENNTPVNTQWGRWVPAERWQEQKDAGLRKFPIEMDWAFCPTVKEWTVHGTIVKGTVNLFEDISPEFAFSAPWLWKWNGCKVQLHFDPRDTKCFATIVALEAANGCRAGDILGQAEQINQTTGFIRTVLGWGDDPITAGLKARQRNAAAMVRELRGVIPSGRGMCSAEVRDGIAEIRKGEVGTPAGQNAEPTKEPASEPRPALTSDEAESVFETRRREQEAFEQAHPELFT